MNMEKKSKLILNYINLPCFITNDLTKANVTGFANCRKNHENITFISAA
jgi:hypothetical protein